MTDIDTLSGIDLALAVSRAQGYEVREWHAEGDWHIIERHESGIATFTPLPRPDQDMNLALALPLDTTRFITIYSDGSCSTRITGYGWYNEKIYPASAICRSWLEYVKSNGIRQADDDRYEDRRANSRLGDAL